jgi:6-phosphogluconate dehydrogenase
MAHKIGIIGLGVMGANLARNIQRNGFSVVGYDLDASKTKSFPLDGARSLPELIDGLERPRILLMMVPAGKPVDDVIGLLRPHLAQGDILIDGGNSFFRDTDRRSDELAAAGIKFLGTGVSGGEEGALLGPAIMPGGDRDAWETVAPILRAIAAKAEDGEPCVSYMGPRGAGHYVKMVHNGIEYGDMQLIAEVYDFLHRGVGLSPKDVASVFETWNNGELRSYLVEITARVLERLDPETGQPLVGFILDEAQQKGTGKWMSQNAFDVGAPIPTVNAAVEARLLSALKAERVAASKVLRGPTWPIEGEREWGIDAARQALYASKIASYAQGLALMRMASDEYGYGIDPGEVAKTWRAGCIIRATLLSDIQAAFKRNPALVNLMVDEAISDALAQRQQGWRRLIQAAVGIGIPVPAIGGSLAYYDAYRRARLPANITQAQRDYFGAHTYRRTDRDGVFHTDWDS